MLNNREGKSTSQCGRRQILSVAYTWTPRDDRKNRHTPTFPHISHKHTRFQKRLKAVFSNLPGNNKTSTKDCEVSL